MTKLWQFETPIRGPLALYAKWEAVKPTIKEYQVNFDTNGGTQVATQPIKKIISSHNLSHLQKKATPLLAGTVMPNLLKSGILIHQLQVIESCMPSGQLYLKTN